MLKYIAKLEKKEIEEDTLILIFKGINETQKWFTIKEDYSKYQEIQPTEVICK